MMNGVILAFEEKLQNQWEKKELYFKDDKKMKSK